MCPVCPCASTGELLALSETDEAVVEARGALEVPPVRRHGVD